MLAQLMGAPLPSPQWIPRLQGEDELGTDELNRLTVEYYRRAGSDRVMDDFRFTASVIRDVVAGMKEENMLIEAGRPWQRGTPVWKAIVGETCDHWKAHADEIERAMK
jgi:hypothetical protein